MNFRALSALPEGGENMGIINKMVRFSIIFNGKTGERRKEFVGIVEGLNHAGTGVIIKGTTVKGIYNRLFSEVRFMDSISIMNDSLAAVQAVA